MARFSHKTKTTTNNDHSLISKKNVLFLLATILLIPAIVLLTPSDTSGYGPGDLGSGPSGTIGNTGGGTSGGDTSGVSPSDLGSGPSGTIGGNLTDEERESVVAAQSPCSANFGLSWLTCVLIDNLLSINKLGFDIISGLLVFNKSMVATENNPVYDYWRQFRNAANIVLLFGFIAVIFSQATSIGLSAYGIKKLLPRLMAFAIIINLSFFICQLAVDVSNIVGSGIMSVAVSVVEGANTQADSTGSVNPLSETADEKWLEVKNIVSQGSNASGGSVAAVLTGGIIGAITLPMLAAMVLPILIIAFLALLVGFVVLIARQIILIGMIVLSPIGIAAAVLPGTKKFYEFWKNTFSSMLFMYPIISMLFGGSFLAADLLGDERLNFFSNPALEAVADGLMTLAIIIVLVSPFFAIPFVIKTSGGMLGKLTGALDKFSMGAGSKAKNYAKERWGEAQKDRQNKYTANLPYRHPLNPRAAMARSRIARMERYRNNEEGAKISTAKIAAEQVRKNPRASEEQKARAEAVLNELSNKEAEIKLKFTYGGDAVKALTEGIRSGDQALINTASSKLIGDGKLDEVQTKMASMSQEQLMATARGINSDSALFGKAKEQDMGFAYALEDASKAQFKNAATGAVDTGLTGSDFMTKFNTAGVNGYDMKVRDAKANAVVGQEAWAIHRQATNGSLDSATAVKVIGQTYTDRGQYKAPQKQELISAAGGALGGRYSNYN